MAVFYPTLENIYEDQMEKHTEGELKLLQTLTRLDDTYNVYYQPHINYAHPDIIIEKEDCGILVIEVKDWNLGAYNFTQEGKFGYLTVQGQNAKLTTPFEQVQKYDDDLFEASPKLYQKKSIDYGIVRRAVYFAKASNQDVCCLFDTEKLGYNYGRKTYGNHTTYWTADDTESLIVKQIEQILRKKEAYDREIHGDIAALLVPSEEWQEQTTPFILTTEQRRFAKCEPGHRRRVKGAAGSGKTLVLAQKAINCFITKESPVLILTYNITLKNYIMDKIRANTREMPGWQRKRAFEILHFDEFLPQMIRMHGLKGPYITQYKTTNGNIDWDNYRSEQMRILREAADKITRYETILIDEAQDYEETWFELINDVFLESDADYLVVADEKQNIYNRTTDEDTKMPRLKGFSGPWAELKENHRLSNSGIRLVEDFQREFFTGKYIIKNDDKREYCHFDMFDAEKIFQRIEGFCHKNPPISRNDVCILACNKDKIRELDKVYRSHLGEKSTTTAYEKKEECDRLIKEEYRRMYERGINEEKRKKLKGRLREEIEKKDSIWKKRFYMNAGTIKMCTVHSFKGWEINTEVLIIDEQDASDELIYTAITRAKKNLLVIDCGNNKYQNFFMKEFALLRS